MLLAIVIGLWAFAELLVHVQRGSTANFDEHLLMILRQPDHPETPLGSQAVQEFMRDISGLGGVGVLSGVTMVASGLLALRGNRRMSIFLLIAVTAGVLVSSGFKMFVDRPRPELVPHGSYVSTASFPSGHSMMSAVVYLTLAVFVAHQEPLLRVRIFLLSIAAMLMLAIGISRVYLAVHWPTDVLAGWTLGICWAMASVLVYNNFVRINPPR